MSEQDVAERRAAIVVNEPNRWRLETPGAPGWKYSARPGAPNKLLMISADCHANEPANLWAERIDPKYRDRLPRIWIDEHGVQWRKSEGYEKADRINLAALEGEDQVRSKAGADPLDRLRDDDLDGIDGEVIFPNKGLAMWATPDPVFAQAQCRVYNDWAWEQFGPHIDRLSPAAALATGDIEGTMTEIERVAKLGFRHVTLPSKPLFGPHSVGELNYNKVEFDPIWAALQDHDLAATFHVSTGKDPRSARGLGGAVINYVVHSLAPTIEPLVHICSSGVTERFPKLRFGTIETGIGWLAWMLDAMDEAYLKHHFWVRPKLKALPSDYFRANGFASLGEDKPGLDLIEKHNLVDNVLWANDYPHHEGTWPHSAEAIERNFKDLSEETRIRVLGRNAAKIFRFPMPARLD